MIPGRKRHLGGQEAIGILGDGVALSSSKLGGPKGDAYVAFALPD